MATATRKQAKNIIILTSGLSGSSVLAATLATSGLWPGDETIKKDDYDTWENSELVKLNNGLLAASNVPSNWTMVFNRDNIRQVINATAELDATSYKAFLEHCNAHSPWLWKDPRLWMTIPYWIKFINPDDTCFILLKRDNQQAWISVILRRHIQTFNYTKNYNEGIHQALVEFVKERNLSHIELTYEDLIIEPEKTLAQINQLANCSLELEHFKEIFRGHLYKKQHGLKSLIKAILIYLKNYGSRYK